MTVLITDLWKKFQIFWKSCDLTLDTWDIDYIADNWEQKYKTIKDGDIAPWKDLKKKNWTKIKEKNKEITILWYEEDRQALAFFLRRPSRLRRSGHADVEYVI